MPQVEQDAVAGDRRVYLAGYLEGALIADDHLDVRVPRFHEAHLVGDAVLEDDIDPCPCGSRFEMLAVVPDDPERDGAARTLRSRADQWRQVTIGAVGCAQMQEGQARGIGRQWRSCWPCIIDPTVGQDGDTPGSVPYMATNSSHVAAVVTRIPLHA